MTDAVEDDRPTCSSSDDAKTRFATVAVVERFGDPSHGVGSHRDRIDGHTDGGPPSEIPETMADRGRPRN